MPRRFSELACQRHNVRSKRWRDFLAAPRHARCAAPNHRRRRPINEKSCCRSSMWSLTCIRNSLMNAVRRRIGRSPSSMPLKRRRSSCGSRCPLKTWRAWPRPWICPVVRRHKVPSGRRSGRRCTRVSSS